MKLLLDEMYPATIAEQLRTRGHQAVSVQEPDYRRLEGAPDEDAWACALADGRALVTENVPPTSVASRPVHLPAASPSPG